MRWLWDNMFGYWMVLLAISLGAAALVYVLWLHEAMHL
jgi:hypothetical protein